MESNLPRISTTELKSWFDSGHKKLTSPKSFELQVLTEINLQGKDLSDCDFRGAIFGNKQDLSDMALERAVFGPTIHSLQPVNLIGVKFDRSNLSNAVFAGVNIIGCSFVDCDLTNADFSFSTCIKNDFSYVKMYGVNFHDTNLFQTKFFRTRLNLKKKTILQTDLKSWSNWCKRNPSYRSTNAERLEQAVSIYLELKENFRTIGSYSDASWAYIQERRSKRSKHSPWFCKECFPDQFFSNNILIIIWFYIYNFILWALDNIVDLSTGYGESLSKTLMTFIFLTTIIFPLIYFFCGGVVLSSNPQSVALNDYKNLLLFSAGNILQGYPGLEAAAEIGKQAQVVQQFVGVILVGLLGFVLGNKISHQ